MALGLPPLRLLSARSATLLINRDVVLCGTCGMYACQGERWMKLAKGQLKSGQDLPGEGGPLLKSFIREFGQD